MSEESKSLVVARQQNELQERPKVDLDATMRPPVEVIGEEERVKKKAPTPEQFFRTALHCEAPSVPGAEICCETFHGFLSAIKQLTPRDSKDGPPIDHVKIKYVPGNNPRIFIEGHGTNIWTAVAINVKPRGKKTFIALLPLRRAISVLNVLRASHKTVVVGADKDRFLIGPYSIPYGGLVEEFESPPTMLGVEGQAILPRAAIEEICSSVAWARSFDLSYPSLHGILLDFEPWTDFDAHPEPLERIVLTAVAMNGYQMNVLRMPQVPIRMVEGGTRSMPPTITVPAGFFYYLKAVVAKQLTSLEIGEKQIAAAGDDYMIMADVSMVGGARPGGMSEKLSKWRTVDVNYAGYWLVDKDEMISALNGVVEIPFGEKVVMVIDARTEEMKLMRSTTTSEMTYTRTLQVRRFKGPPIVDVTVNPRSLLNSVRSCKGGLVRLGFTHDMKSQAAAPITVMGEDENFKSVLMPIN